MRRVDRRVDVRSICEYIENPKQANFVAKAKNTRPRNTMSESDFFAAAQQEMCIRDRCRVVQHFPGLLRFRESRPAHLCAANARHIQRRLLL